MSWNPELLSTTATIAEHEKEINDLAGSTQVWSLLGGAIDVSTDYEVTCPADTDYVIYTNTDGNSVTSLDVTKLVWTIPAVNVISFGCYSSADALLATFNLSEGHGTSLTATNSETATLNNSGCWSLAETNDTWSDKINLARLMIRYEVENALTDRGIWVDELNGQTLADVVTNNETLRVACDYKTLCLIYEDLGLGGMSELYVNKAKRYEQLFRQELALALRRLSLDPSLSGSTTTARADFEGRLQR